MIGTPDQDRFLSTHKWAVVTSLRGDGSPASSVVFYAREGDVLFFSTTEDRLKTKTVLRDPRVVLTTLEEGAPYGFVSVEGTATVHSPERGDDTYPWHVALQRVWRGPDFQAPDDYRVQLAAERRVIVRVAPTRVSGNPNRGR